MSEAAASLLKFPCDFPIKAIGRREARLEERVAELVRQHAPDLEPEAVSSRSSAGGKYIGVTVLVHAQSQAQLDAIYQDLTACPEILMVL